jgi:CRP/FNR family cyclic AMP-dependent transcriptional regulator
MSSLFVGAVQLDGSVLESSALFSGLDREALDGLAQLSRSVRLTAGKTLFRQGDRSDGCYIVFEGVLRISAVSAQGEETLLAMLGAGDVVGEMGLIDGLPRSATAAALKPCSLAFLASQDFSRFADANPAVYRHMLEIISSRLRVTNDAFAAYQLLPLGGRLARVLLRLSEGVGHPLNDGRILIRQKITQAELARMTGSSRENVNRMLNAWRRRQIVSRISSYYCLEQEKILRKLAKI